MLEVVDTAQRCWTVGEGKEHQYISELYTISTWNICQNPLYLHPCYTTLSIRQSGSNPYVHWIINLMIILQVNTSRNKPRCNLWIWIGVLTIWWLHINRDPYVLHQLLILSTRQFKSGHGGQQKAVWPAQRSDPWTTFSPLTELNWMVHRLIASAMLYWCPWLINHVVLSVTELKLRHLPTAGFLATWL